MPYWQQCTHGVYVGSYHAMAGRCCRAPCGVVTVSKVTGLAWGLGFLSALALTVNVGIQSHVPVSVGMSHVPVSVGSQSHIPCV